MAKAIAEANGLGADVNATAINTLSLTTSVDATAGVTIRTRDLVVEANAAATPLTDQAQALKRGTAPISTTDTTSLPSLMLNRTITFNATVLLTGAENPTLVVDASGQVTKQLNLALNASSPVLDVAPILNSLAPSSTLKFTAQSSLFDTLTPQQVADDHYGTVQTSAVIQGTPNVRFITGFDKITISNASTRSLVLHQIEAENTSGQVGQNITVSVQDQSNFHLTPTTVHGNTVITIENTSLAGAPAIVLNGQINNPFGITTK